MADIRFKCDKCGQKLKVDEAGVGLKIACPSCGQMLEVPPLSSEPPSSAAIPSPGPTASPAAPQPTSPSVSTTPSPMPASSPPPPASKPMPRVKSITPAPATPRPATPVAPVARPQPAIQKPVVPVATPRPITGTAPTPAMAKEEAESVIRLNKRNALIFWGVGIAGMIGMFLLLFLMRGSLQPWMQFTIIILEIAWIGGWGWWGQVLWKRASDLQMRLGSPKMKRI